MDAGANCNGHFKAATSEELIRTVSEHFKKKHGVPQPSQTLMNLVAKLSK